MSNENNNIHEFDFQLICEYFSSIERQGPGSPETTAKAISFIDNLTNKSRIVDLGCGTGGQTMVLAKHIQGNITGMDLSPDFIRIFNTNAGFVPSATFLLPENCWTEHFYIPQEKIREDFLKNQTGNKTAEDLATNEQREARLYQKYKAYYGYVFFISKKF